MATTAPWPAGWAGGKSALEGSPQWALADAYTGDGGPEALASFVKTYIDEAPEAAKLQREGSVHSLNLAGNNITMRGLFPTASVAARLPNLRIVVLDWNAFSGQDVSGLRRLCDVL